VRRKTLSGVHDESVRSVIMGDSGGRSLDVTRGTFEVQAFNQVIHLDM